MMLGRLMAFAAAAAVLTTAPAHAAANDCAMLKALARSGDAAPRGIQAVVDRRGGVGLRYLGRPTSLNRATGCELSGPPDLFSIDCTWSTSNDLAAARRELARVKSALTACLSDPFALQDYSSTVEGLEVLDYFKGSYAAKDGDPVEVSLEIHHYAGIDGSYAVILSISR